MTHLIPIVVLLSIAPAVPDTTPRGRYVEARTASIYAGACHYGSEATTAGREAVLVWHFEAGRHRGVDLAGVDVAAVIAADLNLDDAHVARRTLLFVSDRAGESARAAAVDLVRSRHAGVLGSVESVTPAALSAAFTGERYSASAPGVFAIEGALLADRACCKMPYNVWYRPLAPIAGALVGCNRTFRCASKALDRSWSRSDENTSFVGTFNFAPR